MLVKARENSSKIKIESNEGKVPEAIAGLNFSTEQLPTLSDDEGYVPSTEEVKGEGKSTLPADKKEEIEAKLEEKAVEKAAEKEGEEKPEGELTEERKKAEEKQEEGIERFLKPPKGSQAEKDAKLKKGSKDTFDYSQYSEEEVSILKNMPAGNREKVGKLFKNEKDSAKNQQNQFYQSPEG